MTAKEIFEEEMLILNNGMLHYPPFENMILRCMERYANNVNHEIKAKILEGKLASYWSERVLMEQAFIKDPEVTIKGLVERAVQKFGEKMELSRFTRYSVSQ